MIYSDRLNITKPNDDMCRPNIIINNIINNIININYYYYYYYY